MLTDTGPVLAMLDRGDARHDECVAAAKSFVRGPFVTTWPCFAEMMHLPGRAGGHRLQAQLWNWQRHGRLVLRDLTGAEVARAADLMEQYSDTPMDLGDASLVVVAESSGARAVFTLDHHFWGYRLVDGSALEPIPGRR